MLLVYFPFFSSTLASTAKEAQWAKSVTRGANSSLFSSVALDSSGSLYAAGGIYGSGTFDFGNGATASGAYAGGDNVVLVKYSKKTSSWWQKNKGCVYLGIGGAVVATAAVCGPCICFSCAANGLGTVAGVIVHGVVPLIGWAITPKSEIIDSGVMENLINPA